MHHAAESMRTHGGHALYSCEANELHNSFERFFVKHHCNYWNPVEDAFLFELLTVELACMERKLLRS